MNKKPVMLMILDGFGVNNNSDSNAVAIANKPNIDKLMKKYPTTALGIFTFQTESRFMANSMPLMFVAIITSLSF